MQKWALGSVGAIEEFAKIVRDAAGEIVLVGLAEEETSSWWGFKELGCQQAAKAAERLGEKISLACSA